MMEIRRLDPQEYAGYALQFEYVTDHVYDVQADENGFSLALTRLDRPLRKAFTDTLFSEWLEEPVAFGAFEGGELLGFVEGSPETWNNRFRISNICVFDPARRQGSVGTALMQAIERAAEASGARMIVLETQTCNENAIAFYRRNGFALIGLDLYAYSNTDPERREVRLEMGKKLK